MNKLSGWSRRQFVKTGSLFAAMALPLPKGTRPRASFDPLTPIQDSRVKDLAQAALNTMQTLGVAYGDVRLTHKRRRQVTNDILDSESMTVGVRALVDGYWGFAASSIWTVDEMHRLAKESVRQAKANILGKERRVMLAPRPVVTDKHWTTPVQQDPFEVPPNEVVDFLNGIGLYVSRRHHSAKVFQKAAQFNEWNKAFAATDGCYVTQRLVGTGGVIVLEVKGPNGSIIRENIDTLDMESAGWEKFDDELLRREVDSLIEELYEYLMLPALPIDVGRFDTLLCASSIGRIAAQTLGVATELDRALGYEANASGTSYLNDPEAMLGQAQIASPLLSVTANRMEDGGAATVAWDDEGVAPRNTTLIKDGVLTHYQTSRESAMWLKPQNASMDIEAQSDGYVQAEQAIDLPLTYCGNLQITPGKEEQDFTALLAGLRDGIAIKNAFSDIDFMQLNGMGRRGRVYEIKAGKNVARLNSAGFLFRAPEFWKSLKVLGGKSSVVRRTISEVKGEPPSSGMYSVTAVPAIMKDLSIIDYLRKA